MDGDKTVTAIFSQVTARIEDEKLLKDFTVYPNPVGTVLTLRLNEQIKKITIYSIQGQEVKGGKKNR